MITDRQRSAQADTGHPLLCGKPYELFLVCLQTVYGGWGASDGWEGVCVCVCVGGGVNAMTQFDFASRAGGAQGASKITSVIHSS